MLNLSGPVPVTESQEVVHLWLAGSFPTVSPPKVHLFQNNITPTPTNVLANFVEATFDAYAAQTVPLLNWQDPPAIMPDGSILSVYGINLFFDDGGNTTPNTIYGLYITDNAGTTLLGSLRFDTPKVMDDATKFIAIELALVLPPAAPTIAADVTSNG